MNQDPHLIKVYAASDGHLMLKTLSGRVARSFLASIPLTLILNQTYDFTLNQNIAGFLFLGVSGSLAWWVFGACGNYKPQYKIQLIQAFVTLVLIVAGMALLPNPPPGMDLGVYAIANGMSCLAIVYVVSQFRRGKKSFSSGVPSTEPPRATNRWLAFHGVVVTIYTTADLLLVSALLNASETGVYRVAITFVSTVGGFWGMLQSSHYVSLVASAAGAPVPAEGRNQRAAMACLLVLITNVVGAAFCLGIGGGYDGLFTLISFTSLTKAVTFLYQFHMLEMYVSGEYKKAFTIVCLGAAVGLVTMLLLTPRLGLWGAAVGMFVGESSILLFARVTKFQKPKLILRQT